MKGNKTKDVQENKGDLKLSNEFKDEIITERKHHNWGGIILIILIFVIMFGSLGLGAYQIFYRKDQATTVAPEDKIKSIPDDTQAQPATPAQPTVQQPTVTTPTPAQPAYTEYTIQSGDTWSSVANENGMSSSTLMKYNGSTSEDLQIGQVIKIPKQ